MRKQVVFSLDAHLVVTQPRDSQLEHVLLLKDKEGIRNTTTQLNQNINYNLNVHIPINTRLNHTIKTRSQSVRKIPSQSFDLCLPKLDVIVNETKLIRLDT